MPRTTMPSTGLSGGALALDQMTANTYVPAASQESLQQAQQQAAKLERVPSAPSGRAVTRRSSSFSMSGQPRNVSLDADRARRASLEQRFRRSASSTDNDWVPSEARTGFWSWVPRIGRFGGRGAADQPDRLETLSSTLPPASDAELARARQLAAKMSQ